MEIQTGRESVLHELPLARVETSLLRGVAVDSSFESARENKPKNAFSFFYCGIGCVCGLRAWPSTGAKSSGSNTI
jgi:hypothetical protein